VNRSRVSLVITSLLLAFGPGACCSGSTDDDLAVGGCSETGCAIGELCDTRTGACFPEDELCTEDADCAPFAPRCSDDGQSTIYDAAGVCDHGRCDYGGSQRFQPCANGCIANGCVLGVSGDPCFSGDDCEAGLTCDGLSCATGRLACIPDHLDPTDDNAPQPLALPHLETVSDKYSLCEGDVDQLDLDLTERQLLFLLVEPRVGTVNLSLLGPDGSPLTTADGALRVQLRLPVTRTGHHTLIVEHGADDRPINTWRLGAAVLDPAGAPGCRSDFFEPNDTPADATPIRPAEGLDALPYQTLCPDDVDTYTLVPLTETLTLDFDRVPAEGLHVRVRRAHDDGALWEDDLHEPYTLTVPTLANEDTLVEVSPATTVPVPGLNYSLRAAWTP